MKYIKLFEDFNPSEVPQTEPQFTQWVMKNAPKAVYNPQEWFWEEINKSNSDLKLISYIIKELDLDINSFKLPEDSIYVFDQYGLADEEGDMLLWAILKNNVQLVKLLIESGVNLNVALGYINEYTTYLHMAVILDNPEITKLLIENGAKVNQNDSEGNLPEEYASEELLLAVPELKVIDELDESAKATGDRSPIDSASIEKALKRKSEKTGVPISYLRIIMRRGMAAWKSGHRPGAGQQQWGYARLASFLTGRPTTWGSPKMSPKGGADSDVAKEIVRKGHTKGLKFFKKKVNEESEHKYYKGLSQSTIEKKKKMMKKQAEMPDDDPNAYKELPGDTKGKSQLKTSKHIERFDKMYKEDDNQSK
jgi:hypothetical protein